MRDVDSTGEQSTEQPTDGYRSAIDSRRCDHLEKWKFKPGQSGNPNGLPKGRVNLSSRIRRELLRQIDADATFADALAKRIVRAILDDPVKGERLIRAIQDRDEGPVLRGSDTLVQVGVDARGNGTPKPPPITSTGDGSPTFRQHLGALVSIASDMGIDLLEDVPDAVVMTKEDSELLS